MGEEFQGGVCGGTWWNSPRTMLSGSGAGGFSSPCSVAQLGGGGGAGGYDMSDFGWPSEAIKDKPNAIDHNFEKNTASVYENSTVFSADMDSTLDIFCFGPSIAPDSSTTHWNQPHLLSKDGGQEGNNFGTNLQDDVSLGLCYGMRTNSPTIMNPNNFQSNNINCSQEESPPLALTTSSNSSGDSSTITCEGGLTTSYPMDSSASYLIQTLFDDTNDSQFMNPNYGALSSNNELVSPCSWVKANPNINTPQIQPPTPPQLAQNSKLNGAMSMLINDGQGLDGRYSTATTLCNIQASMLNSLQSRSRAASFNQKTHSCVNNLGSKVNNNEQVRDSKNNISEKAPANKKLRIETPSPLPTFKVRKEKLGDRITALQQLVSPFGKTDTASVLHEAIEYIKFLHDQVNALSTPYLKNEAAIQHQQGSDIPSNNEAGQDLRSRGLCLVPISITYPVAQETPVDFWTPTFGGTTFR